MKELMRIFTEKYEAYYGVRPFSPIQIEQIEEIPARKLVTRYQGYILPAGMEPMSLEENASIWIFCTRQVWEVKMHRALECLK